MNFINGWCERKELKLFFVLPVYFWEIQVQKWTSIADKCLNYLNASRCLDENEQEKINKLIKDLSIK